MGDVDGDTAGGLFRSRIDLVEVVLRVDNLVMDIIAPQSTGDDDNRRYPTVVFVQGSAWTTSIVPHRTV